jgi:hypothetical protein
MKKILLYTLLPLLILELSLQLWAFLYTGYSSFDFFLQDAENKIKKADQNTVFFVGDSTVYGLGCSGNPAQLSLPAQLEKLMKAANPQKSCINLGYSATSTEEHLKIMQLLPKGATVFYRGGISDDWNTGDETGKFSLFGMIFELRTIKMLSILFSGLRTPDHQKRNNLIHTGLHRLLAGKKLQLYTIDYTTYPQRPDSRFTDFFYLPAAQRPGTHIPLKELLNNAGHLENGILKPQFISMTGTHPNDLGYFLEALFIFNFLCTKGLLGFSPDQIQPVNSINNMLDELKKEYQKAREKLHVLKPHELKNGSEPRKQAQDNLFKIWNLSRIFSRMEPENENYRLEQEMSEKLGILLFHDSRILMMHLGGKPNSTTAEKSGADESDSAQKERLYDYVRQLLIISTLQDRQANRNSLFDDFPLQQEFMSFPYPPYISQLPPFPLELCERFIQKANIRSDIISTEKEWSHFSNQPYSYFKEHIPQICQNQKP